MMEHLISWRLIACMGEISFNPQKHNMQGQMQLKIVVCEGFSI